MDHRTITTAHRLKAAADGQGLSIRQLVDRTGIGFGTLQGILTGAREPKLTHLFILADALDLDVADLLAGRGAA